ncbi:DUF503 family protein [Myxococcota bacterium]|nr:DUF503 family protein [Myxococcota bacterium]MCZ7618655.1 DUF503 domain-containing protein [Myxococcota bacterium]
MIVAAAVVELHVHGSQSLKQKRGVVRSITQRVRNRFNVSIAEIGGQGTWQVAVLGIVMTGSDRRTVRSQLQRALVFLEELHLAEVTGSDFELLELCYEGAERDEDDPLSAADFGAHHDPGDED